MTELEYFKGDELAASVWRSKYALEGEKNPDDMHRRMAKEFARIESKYNRDISPIEYDNLSSYGRHRNKLTEESIYELFKDFKYIIPGGSVMSGIGSPSLTSLSNCFVIGSPDDSYSSIMRARTDQIQLMKRRGGVGYDLSRLRPRGAKVNNSAKVSTGAASFMDVCSDITNEVAQGGRRGALMLTLSIVHPDSLEFIEKKQDLTKVTGANISIKIPDDFMTAVTEDADYILRYPVTASIPDMGCPQFYSGLKYDSLDKISTDTLDTVYIKKVRAKELWDKLVHCAWSTAEPGIIFESEMVNNAPDAMYDEFRAISTNPCSEIGMGAYDSCRLIHLNLTSCVANPFTSDAHIDFYTLRKISYEATRLADDLVDLEVESIDRILEHVQGDGDEYNLWVKIRNTAIRGRRSGVGFTGLADVLAMLGYEYGSVKSLSITNTIMCAIATTQLDCQIDMSIERGYFPAWDPSKDNGKWSTSMTLLNKGLWSKMIKLGRRNISWSTVAPTGTVSILAQCSSGIEPVFMPYYQRKKKCTSPEDRVDYTDIKGEKYTLFTVVHHNLVKWAFLNNLWNDKPIEDWTLDEWKDAYKRSPYNGSSAHEINWENRLKMQECVQRYITHSISSTINLPACTTEYDIGAIYREAWLRNLKGITVYRDGCREGVLTSNVDKERRLAPKRPKKLEADCYTMRSKGEQYIVLVGLLEGKPYEIFALRPKNEINVPPHKGEIVKKAKMRYIFNSEHISNLDILYSANISIEEKAATLYASMLLRHGVDIKYIVKTAKKVNDNIVSFSSAMCRVLSKYISSETVSGEVCPECGSSLTRSGGCISCSNCGYSKCS